MPLKIVRNNIVNMEADVIVNTANHLPIVGSGVDSTIYEAAGFRQLLAERQRIGEIPYGSVAATSAFALKAKFIFHAVTPCWRGGDNDEVELLRSCYEKIMCLALEYNCQSIALPLLATGNNAYPKGLSLQLATEIITKYLAEADIMVYLVVYDKASFTVAGKLFADIESLLDEEDIKEEYFCEKCASFEDFIAKDYKENRQLLNEYRDEICCSLKYDDYFAEKKIRFSIIPKADTKKKISGIELDEALTKLLKKTESVSFSEKLFQIIEERGFDEVEVYKNANMDRKLFSKLRKKNYKPSKNTVIALGISLHLSLEEVDDLLRQAGYALAPNNKFDRIVSFCIEKEVYNIHDVNIALFNFTGTTIN